MNLSPKTIKGHPPALTLYGGRDDKEVIPEKTTSRRIIPCH
jgi:hypothetical protein